MPASPTVPARNNGACRRYAFSSVLACIALGCTGGSEADTAGLPAIRDSIGITIVENAAPLWEAGTEWHIGRLITTIGTVEGTPEYQLFHAFDATRLSDGTLAIANSSTSEIRLFDSNGVYLRSMGGAGGGPGEFRGTHTLRSIDHTEGDTLLAWDLYAQTMLVFTPHGDFVRSHRLRNTNRMYFLGRALSGGGGLFADGTMLLALFSPGNPTSVLDGMERQIVRLVRFSAEGDSLGMIGDFEGSDILVRRAGEGHVQMREAPFGRMLTARTAGVMAYVATGETYEVALYGTEGDLRRLIRREHPPVPVTAALLDWQRERETANAPERRRQAIQRDWRDMTMPETLPPYRTIEVDTELNLWVQEYSVGEDAKNEWSVFDPQGAWLGTVTMPPGLVPYEIGADYVLGKERDELDVEYIIVYELLKP